jgi:replicative DNA helicase Mcm
LLRKKAIRVEDAEPTDDLESLHVVLLGDEMTRNVKVGEMAAITGDIHVFGGSGSGGKSDLGKKLFAVLFARHIVYEREEVAPTTEEDITSFKQFAQKSDLMDELAAKFAPNVIGHSNAKLGILRAAVNAKENSRRNSNSISDMRNRIHTLLAGDPGTAKSMLAKEATMILPNSRYVTAQLASVKSLLVIIYKEADNKMLLLGAVPQAKKSFCSINEVGSMPYEDQLYLADVMEEGWLTIDKHGIYQEKLLV